MKTNTKALAIYMQSEEVKNGFFTKNLDTREDIQEKINFLERVQGKEVKIKWYDEENVKISEYENSKSYSFPIDILQEEETQEEEEKEEEIQQTKTKISIDKIVIIFLILIIMSIFWFLYKWSFTAEAIQTENKVSEFEIIYNKIKEKETIIQKELEIQKQARVIEKESIKKVTETENEIKELRLNALNLSNNIK